ncbi:MAG: TetR/AcrR family transcriptional regulator [Aeromonas sp.]
MTMSPRSQQKRTAILDAAGRLFCQHGLHLVSMDMVASLAGVSKQTVYSHFANKESLFAQAVGNKCVNSELLPELLQSGSSVRESLVAFGRSFRTLILSDDAINIFRTCISCNDPALAALFFEAGPRYVTEILASWLEQQKQQGLLSHPHSEQAAMQLLLMWQGKERMLRELGLPLTQSPAEQDGWTLSCIDLFLAAAAPSSTPFSKPSSTFSSR